MTYTDQEKATIITKYKQGNHSKARLFESSCQRKEKGYGQTTISCGQAQPNLGQ